MITRHHPTTDRRGRANALWLLLLFGGLALLLTSSLVSQDGKRSSGEGSNSDGGDNPVVGSLPCAVDPELDFKFVQGASNAGVMLPVPTLGFVGQDLASEILDANGTPEGRVNRRAGYDILGLVNQGSVVVSRAALREGRVDLAQWVPDSYKGGCITSSGTLGSTKSDLLRNLNTLSLKPAATSLYFIIDQWYFISPPTPIGGQAPQPLTVHVAMTPQLATITFLP